MARAPRRVQTQSQPLYDDNSDGGSTEPETPKPRRAGIRKRISEAYNDQDASFVSDSGTGGNGQKSAQINDDAAEKRRRRKSTRMTVPVDDNNAEAGPSSGGVEGQEQAGSSRPKQKLDLPLIPPPVLNKSDNIEYEQWMKIATENVCAFCVSRSQPDIYSVENQSAKHMGCDVDRLLSRHDAPAERGRQLHQLSTCLLHVGWVRQNLDQPSRQCGHGNREAGEQSCVW